MASTSRGSDVTDRGVVERMRKSDTQKQSERPCHRTLRIAQLEGSLSIGGNLGRRCGVLPLSSCDSAVTVRSGEQETSEANANSNVCNGPISGCNEIKPGAGEENRTCVLSLGCRLSVLNVASIVRLGR